MSDGVLLALVPMIMSMAGYIVKQWKEITDLKIKLAAYDSAAPALIEKMEELIELERSNNPVASSLRRPHAPRQAVRKRRTA
jgi:hypothetical protein